MRRRLVIPAAPAWTAVGLPHPGDPRPCLQAAIWRLPTPTKEVHGDVMEEAVRRWNEDGSFQLTLRNRQELAGFFDRLELLEPGVVSCSRWRPERRGRGRAILRRQAQALRALPPEGQAVRTLGPHRLVANPGLPA
jgi:hypothetical protein